MPRKDNTFDDNFQHSFGTNMHISGSAQGMGRSYLGTPQWTPLVFLFNCCNSVNRVDNSLFLMLLCKMYE